MALGIPSKIKGLYNPTDAWFYDRYIATAVLHWVYRASLDLDAAFGAAKRLLDVGCGGGQYLTEVAARHPHIVLAGVDTSEKQVARANSRLAEMDRPPGAVVGDALHLPYSEGEFDMVVSVASIKHWPDQRRGLAECCRALRPGGTLLIVEADRGARDADLRDFVGNLAFPRTVKPMLPVLLSVVRKFVHGRSLDLSELRALTTDLPLDDMRVERVTEAPALRITGTKRA